MSVDTGGFGDGRDSGGDDRKPSSPLEDHLSIKGKAKRYLLRNPRALLRLIGVMDTSDQRQAGLRAAPVIVAVSMADNAARPGYATVNDSLTTLTTSGFAGCFGVILLGPRDTRTLAHINSWHFPVRSRIWNNVEAFRELADAAHTAHIYHWPGSWAQGDSHRGDEFIAYFGLASLNIVVHGSPADVQVDPAGHVTP